MKCKCCICAAMLAAIAVVVLVCKNNAELKCTFSGTAGKIGDDVSRAAGKVGKDITQAAKDIGSDLSDAADEIKDMMKQNKSLSRLEKVNSRL